MPLTLEEIENLKARHKRFHEAKDPTWFQKAVQCVDDYVYTFDPPFTIDDVRALIVDKMGPPHHPSVWGALILCCKSRGIIVEVGRTPTERKSSHGREVRMFVAP